MHHRTREILTYLAEQRTHLSAAVETVPEIARGYRVSPDVWSVAEILEHLSMVEARMGKAFEKVVLEAHRIGVGEETDESSILPLLDVGRLINRGTRLVAAETSQPTGQVAADDAWAKLTASREALTIAIRHSDGLALEQVSLQHPRLGPLNGYQWLLFIGAHEARHAEQIREIALPQ
jgi:hypothetical protein